MLDLAQPETRIAIAIARREAMVGRIKDALDRLNEVISTIPDPLNKAAILQTKAEMLYLDGKCETSYQVFVSELDVLLPKLPHAVALIVGFNRSEVAITRVDSAGVPRHYDLIDEQRIAGIEHWDSSAMMAATNNAARGRSYESLPTIWRELLRAYRQGRWAVFREASRYMADECIRIHLPQEAAFHALIALDCDCAKQIGEVLLISKDVGVVEATVTKLLLTANLQRHFIIACELLQKIADLIPDHLVDRVLDWLLLRGANVGRSEGFSSVETTAWVTIELLAARASPDAAERIVRTAVTHRAWIESTERPDQYILTREEIVNATVQAVVALPINALRMLADATIPLATERRNFKDFKNVVNLLSHVAHRASDDIKAKITSALYPAGKPIPPALVQAAPYFGKELLNKDGQFARYAAQVAQSISQVVQHVPKGEDAKPVDGTVMTWNSEKENENLVVHLISTESVWGLIRHKNQVPEDSRRAVIYALLEAISNRENLLENRVSFIDCIRGFADCLDTSQVVEIFRVLGPIARGNIEISSDVASSMSQSNPLNRFHVNGATIEQVIAQALFVLACIEHACPGRYGARLQALVRMGLSNASPTIRKYAFAAVREIPTIAEGTWMPLLLGTRDPDDEAAALAFDAISAKKNLHLTRAQWKMATYSLRIAQLSISIKLRKAAAKAVSRLEPQAPNKAIREELSEIRGLFSSDIAHSIRKVASMVGGVEIP
jgi:hypothetical protein